MKTSFEQSTYMKIYHMIANDITVGVYKAGDIIPTQVELAKKYDEIAEAINQQLNRGVTVLYGEGWYSKEARKVLVVLAKRRESINIFRLIKRIDPNAFVSQSNVVGVYGEGFDHIKVK